MFRKNWNVILISFLILLASCNANNNFDYVVVFSDETAYFFNIKNSRFIENDVIFINEKELESIENELTRVKKILLTREFNNSILNDPLLNDKIFYLNKVKFSLSRAIDSILNSNLKNLNELLIIYDKSLNEKDNEYLEYKINEFTANAVLVNDININYLKNFITPKIKNVAIFSIDNNILYINKLLESYYFKNISLTIIANKIKKLNELHVNQYIKMEKSDLVDIVKRIDNNFEYGFNIYQK